MKRRDRIAILFLGWLAFSSAGAAETHNVDICLNGRIFFSSLHQRERIAWSGFERVSDNSAAGEAENGRKEK